MFKDNARPVNQDFHDTVCDLYKCVAGLDDDIPTALASAPEEPERLMEEVIYTPRLHD